jgi:hypothetical protein
VNDAANPLRRGYPRPITSYTFRFDDAWNALDGKVWFTEVPQNTRWTNYASPNAQDYYGVDFGVPTPVTDIRWYGYDDGGGVRPAAAYRVQYWTGAAWQDVPDQARDAAQPVGNGPNRVTFSPVTTTQVRLLFTNPPGAYVGVTEFEAWSTSSGDARVAVGPVGTDGAVRVDGATPVDVTVTNATHQRLLHPAVSLAVPGGWTASPTGTSGTRAIAPGGSAVWHFTVTPPAGVVGLDADLVATATYTRQRGGTSGTHTRQPLTVAFDPAKYPRQQVVDDFSANTLADYTVRQPFPDEVVPTLAAGGGRLRASAGQRFFALLDRGVSPASADSVVIVDPAGFIGNASHEDTFFVGLSRDDTTYIGAWYNNHARTSGIDVRVDGRLNPAGNGVCCTPVTLVPGDRLALQSHGTTVTTWAEHGGTWQRLESTDVGSVINLSDPATRSAYHAMFGVRGDSGTVAAGGFEVRDAG